MFELLFRYPSSAYARGHLVLLGSWPVWALGALIVAAGVGLALLLRTHYAAAAGGAWRLRVAGVWGLQAAVLALILLLLWQPALSLAELKPQQNIVAVLVDDSRSMAIADEHGQTREAAAEAALNGGLLANIERRYQARVFRLDSGVTRVASVAGLRPSADATRLGAGLRQLLEQTSDLPLGGVVLLSDGADATGIDRDTMQALLARHIPVQTVGFGSTAPPRDVEIEDVLISPRAMAKSRMEATVRFEQHGFAGQRVLLTARTGGRLLASREVTLGRDDLTQSQQLLFNAGEAGPKTIEFRLAALAGEANAGNNAVSRLVNVTSEAHRVLYIEGEPRWEYKFIRRAEEHDPQVQLVSMVRATENKIYRQGISDPSELADGFPSRAEDLFRYQGLIIGSVEAAYFTPVQQDLITAFANRRGGGVLFLGGQYSLGDGGWAESSMAPLLPVTLPDHKGTFVRSFLTPDAPEPRAQLAPAGASSLITRLADEAGANANAWNKLPWLMDYQDAGVPKPGAVVLANVLTPDHRTLPLLTIEDYGRGRTAVLATSGTWRWQMNLPLGDPSHDVFWQQLLRWLVNGTPGRLTATAADPILYDAGHTQISAEVRDAQYNPSPNAEVSAHVLGPDGTATDLVLHPSPSAPGEYAADFSAQRPGAYVAQVSAPGVGQDVVTFERLDGVAENFHTQQNRDLLQRLARQTGGQYWAPDQAARIAASLPFSDAGITTRDNLPLWNLPIVFFLLLALPLLEWFLRRKWGVV